MISMIRNNSFLKLINTLDVRKKNFGNRACIYLKCTGFLKKRDAQVAVNRSKHLMQLEPHRKHIIIWNCIHMYDYDTDAFNLIQDLLSESNDKIESLWVITESLTVHAAVEIISFFTSTKIRVAKSFAQLECKMVSN